MFSLCSAAGGKCEIMDAQTWGPEINGGLTFTFCLSQETSQMPSYIIVPTCELSIFSKPQEEKDMLNIWFMLIANFVSIRIRLAFYLSMYI